ncbi:hypothetical protein [Clostridium novyi]
MEWLFYIGKVHLNYTKQEFLNSTFGEIATMWKLHCNFNNWTIKSSDDNGSENRYEKVNIDDLPL